MKKTVLASSLLLATMGAQAGTLFTNVDIFNGVDNKLYKDHYVLVEGNKITQISDKSINTEGHEVIDGEGKTLMPGLVDTHVHLRLNEAKNIEDFGINQPTDLMAYRAVDSANEFLMSGFTTVRDIGANDHSMFIAEREGTIQAPRIFHVGRLLSPTAGHADWRGRNGVGNDELEKIQYQRNITAIVDSPDEMRKEARVNFGMGASGLKIMTSGGITSEVDPKHYDAHMDDEVIAAVETAKSYDSYVATHVINDEDVKRSAELGVFSLEHCNGMSSDEAAKAVKEAGAFCIPAMAAFDKAIVDHPFYGNPENAAYHKVIPLVKNAERFGELFKKHNFKIAYGTDLVMQRPSSPMARARRDVQIYQMGELFGNYETLVSMTSNAYDLLSMNGKNKMNPYPMDKFGSIQVGYAADIILVDGNPLEDLSVIGAVPAVSEENARTTATVSTMPYIMKDGKEIHNTL